MRSREEILFRLRQEAQNLWLWRRPPRSAPMPLDRLPRLPDPESVAASLRGSTWAEGVERIAESILAHRIPLFDRLVDVGPEIDWRRDYVAGISSGLRYFRRVPYLDARQVGDHKNVWEMNRHQHLALLAQAHLLTGRSDFLDEIWAQLESWLDQNPFAEGINWASALEVAFRALSWIWVHHLVGQSIPGDLRARFMKSLYRHGLFLENNFSVYFSPNTHLLGEAVALHALGVLFSQEGWREYGSHWVEREMERQVQPDGMHFEQSTYYHVYALDMFLFHALLQVDVSPHYRQRLGDMADVLALLLGERGAIPFLGDDDGGRFFHPYGARDRFGRATLTTCARFLGRGSRFDEPADQAVWWLGLGSTPEPAGPLPVWKSLDSSGLIVCNTAKAQIVLDTGPFGAGSGGHSHADTLSLVVNGRAGEMLIDPGTYTYVGDPVERDRFRGSAMHNTLHVPGSEQATPLGSFRWGDKPLVEVERCEEHVASMVCRCRSYWHRRRLGFVSPNWLAVVDETDAMEAVVSWHLGPVPVRLLCTAPLAEGEGWRSRVYGSKEPIRVFRAAVSAAAPVATLIDLAGTAESVVLAAEGDGWRVSVNGSESILL